MSPNYSNSDLILSLDSATPSYFKEDDLCFTKQQLNEPSSIMQSATCACADRHNKHVYRGAMAVFIFHVERKEIFFIHFAGTSLPVFAIESFLSASPSGLSAGEL